MEFLNNRQEEIVEGLCSYFAERCHQEPHNVLAQVEKELEALYIRMGNDWTGRGIVGDTTQGATIAGLEAVRAECLERLKKLS